MKKIIKLSIVLLGAFFVLLGCRSESKAEFALEVSISKQKVTYMYDQEKDSVSSLTFNISYDFSKNKEYEEKARRQREKIVKEMDGIDGIKVTQSDSEKEIAFTVDVDLKKFKYDDEESRSKAPALYSSVHSALVKKNDRYSFEESKKKILEEGFKEVK